MTPRRCVVDTNIRISATLQPSGAAAEVLAAIGTAGGMLLFSEQTFAELVTRLMRPKFDRYVEPAERRQFLSDIAAVGEWIAIQADLRASRDPDDDKFLETAVRGEADCLVTGDRDLLMLDPFRGIRVLCPRDFLSAAMSGSQRP